MEEQYDPRYYVAPASDSTFAGMLTRRLPLTPGIAGTEPTIDDQQLEQLEEAEDIQDVEKSYINIREYAREAIINSKIHGLPELLKETNPVLRGFFSIIMIINLGLCIYMCWLSISAYLANTVMTTYQIKVQAPIEFPVVQICNLNGFDALKASSYVDQLVEGIKPENYVTTMEYVTALNEQLRSKLIRGYANDPELRYTLGFGIEEMLVSCRFQSRNCSVDEFLPYFDFYYGMCYRFNQGKQADGADKDIETVGQQGWPNGLRVELYVGNSELQEKYMINKGFKVIVFNKSRIYQDAQASGVEVTTGHVTNLAFIREVSQHMSAPYGNCIDTEDPNDIDWSANPVLSYMHEMFIQDNLYSNENWTWAWPLTYTQDACMSICYQRYLYDECECFDVTLPLNEQKLVNQTICYQNDEDYQCMQHSASIFYADHNLLTNCYSNCPKECERIDFVFSISTSLYPSLWYANELTSNGAFNKVVNQQNLNISYKGNYSALAGSTAIVNVFYDALFYTQIDETPAMTADLLFGLVGGNIGFFFDASILSMIETILLLAIVSYQVFKRVVQMVLPKKPNEQASKQQKSAFTNINNN